MPLAYQVHLQSHQKVNVDLHCTVLIKQSRARHMFEKYKLMQLPISDLSLKEMFDGLILCRCALPLPGITFFVFLPAPT